jgi:hypothetical protein
MGQPIPMPQRHSRYGIVHEGRTLSDARVRWNARAECLLSGKYEENTFA